MLSVREPSNSKTPGKELIQACQEHPDNFKRFCDKLVKQECQLFVTAVGRCRLASSKRSRLWSGFHCLSINDLPKIWKSFLEETSSESRQTDKRAYSVIEDNLFQQSVNQKLFEHLLQEYFAPSGSPTVMEATTREVVLGKDELNAVRYAAGFVPHILLKKYEKQTDKKSSQFVQ